MDIIKPTTITDPEGIDLNKQTVAQGQLINDGTFDRVLIGFQKGGFGTKDLGIKVSKEGYDVKTAADDELIFNSSQNMFKVVISDSTTVIGSSSLTYGTPQTATIPHNLGYVPAFNVYVNPSSPIPGFQGGDGLSNLPLMYFSAGAVLLLLQARADSTNLYLDVINTNSGTYDLDLYSWTFKYYLLQETAT